MVLFNWQFTSRSSKCEFSRVALIVFVSKSFFAILNAQVMFRLMSKRLLWTLLTLSFLILTVRADDCPTDGTDNFLDKVIVGKDVFQNFLTPKK